MTGLEKRLAELNALLYKATDYEGTDYEERHKLKIKICQIKDAIRDIKEKHN